MGLLQSHMHQGRHPTSFLLVHGKSSRLAQLLVQPATASLVPDPDPAPGSGPCTNKATIAHASLHCYLLEDVLFSSLGDTLLLCVFESHPTFSVYHSMAPSANLLLVGKEYLLELHLSLSRHPQQNEDDVVEPTGDEVVELGISHD